jgi:hypothetical protein
MEANMTPEQRIDANIDALLRASGSGIDYYTMPRTLQAMREVMRRIMSDSYIKGTQDNFDALVASGRLNK